MARKRPTSNNFRNKHPRKVGDFLKLHDANGGHPVRVYFSDPANDIYFVQRFSKHYRKDRKKLIYNIDPDSNEAQWLVKKPEAIGYDDMIYEPRYLKFRIHSDDEGTIKKYQKYNLKKNR